MCTEITAFNEKPYASNDVCGCQESVRDIFSCLHHYNELHQRSHENLNFDVINVVISQVLAAAVSVPSITRWVIHQ
jgi:hypothetical protein